MSVKSVKYSRMFRQKTVYKTEENFLKKIRLFIPILISGEMPARSQNLLFITIML